ncbi:MAG: hypothetical protein JWQ87_5196 [Candidatus Sulfotelmatobacter sp.]|nr:hypothetical protein [Candidatus Sulfotelmatobacter sp.]
MIASSVVPSPQPSVWVREVQTADGAVLLDIRQGRCLSLNPVGAEIWHLLKLGNSLNDIAAQLATQFEEAADRTLNDTRDFLAELWTKGLLESTEPKQMAASKLRTALISCSRIALSTPGSAASSLIAKALVALAGFDVLAFSSDFAAVHELVRAWPTVDRAPDNTVVDRVSRAVNYACVWYPKRVLCLQRSAVTTCLLRSAGVPAEMVIGAQKYPFRAHAWTEVNRRPINERRNVQSVYLIWERC